MEVLSSLVFLLVGLVIGFLIGRFVYQKTIVMLEESMKQNQESEQKMGLIFENLANKIFDQKSNSFDQHAGEKMSNVLNPLNISIKQFKEEFNIKFLKQNDDRIRLEEELKRLNDLNQNLSQDANNLASALSGSVKAQGNWGEIILEKVLKYSGLKEGDDFIREGKGLGLKDSSGAHLKPDVIVNLPDEKHLVIDSKVTLNSYTRFINATNEEQRESELSEFVKAIKNHIDGLQSKQYHLLEKLVTPEYVMMFMPIEGAFSLALQKDPTLFEYGWERKIILVGPTNLLATLKATESVWRQDRQEKNALKIAIQGGKLYDKFVGFIDDMQGIENHLNKSQQSYDNAFKKLSSGNGNLIGQAEKMKVLGAKANKKIEKELLDETNNQSF